MAARTRALLGRRFFAHAKEADSIRRPSLRWLGHDIPPLYVLWSYRALPATELNTLKAARAALVWRGASGLDGLRILMRFLLWVRFPFRVLRAVVAEGRNTRSQFGTAVLKQLSDIIRLALINNLMPKDYYRAALARHKRPSEMLSYVPFDLIRIVARQMTSEVTRGMIRDKSAFEIQCRAAGLSVVRSVALATDGTIKSPIGKMTDDWLPDRDLIIKPLSGSQGRLIELWLCEGEDKFTRQGGGDLSPRELANRAVELARAHKVGMLLQERVQNHVNLAPIAGSALATTRVVTMINESGEPEVVDAFYRTSIAPHAAVDNFHAGGMLFPVDIHSGCILPGMTDAAYRPSGITHHPQTGKRVAGQVHPGWEAITALARRLHCLFPDLLMPGWDIGYADDGAIAVEGNDIPGFSINRQATFSGLVGTRTFALLTYHTAHWLERNVSEGSRWRLSTSRRQADHF